MLFRFKVVLRRPRKGEEQSEVTIVAKYATVTQGVLLFHSSPTAIVAAFAQGSWLELMKLERVSEKDTHD